jgi:hypothetical protein
MRRAIPHTLMALPLLIGVLVAPAIAQEIPNFDSAALCEELAGDSGEAAIRRCRFAQDYGLSELETFWPTTTAAIRETCIERIEEQSYAELAHCVLRLRRAR